ncbi:ATP-binding protein [Gordonia sp. OPL2]|uniref:ATP-binding protein n=1 Tax=Gordonia sp. OPL2 TaxID=2486274 RepID=UPI0021CC6380|nr:ATP-binding protein [Gordonia sp. OPL2]ROZ89153.1 anti-sigma factor [Gordonia sp. OPL2]
MSENSGATAERQVIGELTHAAEAPVELSVPARSDRLPIVRSMVERTLFIDDWSVDDVADVNLGIDEICSQLIMVAAPDTRLSIALNVGPQGAVVQVDGVVSRELGLDTSGFGWRVVETVTDAQTVSYSDSGGDRQVTVHLAKHRV